MRILEQSDEAVELGLLGLIREMSKSADVSAREALKPLRRLRIAGVPVTDCEEHRVEANCHCLISVGNETREVV